MIINATASQYSALSTSTTRKKETSNDYSFNDFINEGQQENSQPEARDTSTVNFGGRVNVFASFQPENVTETNVFTTSRTASNETSGSTTTIKLTKEEQALWENNKVEKVRFVNAGGVIFSGGRKTYDAQQGIYYTADAEYDYQFAAFYDENSPEDNPVMYLYKCASSTTSLHYSEFMNNDEVVKVEVNKVNPSNATYEEMIALVGYIYRDDAMAASEASEAVDMARAYMEIDGLDWQNGAHDYSSYYLPEVVRRNKDYPNPSNQALSRAADKLLANLQKYQEKIENSLYDDIFKVSKS